MLTKEETWDKLCKLRVVYGQMPEGRWEEAGFGHLPDLAGINLQGIDLSGAYLGDACLSEVILNEANFSGADLIEADFRGANLSKANFSKADLYKADFSTANLSNANLSNAAIHYTSFSRANLSSASLQESGIDEANLNLANLSGADITGSTFWGVSTTGWKIDGIKAQHVYFCRSAEVDKEKYRRNFLEGQFEDLFKSLPTIELIFIEGLNPISLLTLSMVIERIGLQNPSLGIKMADIRKNEFETRVGVKISNDEHLYEVGRLIHDATSQAASKISSNIFPAYFKEALEKASQQHLSSIVVNIMQPTFQFIKADGSTLSGTISQCLAIQNSAADIIIKNYDLHKEKVDNLFESLKYSFGDYEASMSVALTEATDRMIEAIRKGKEVGTIQQYWDEIKEGVKTGGAAVTIASTIGRLLGLI